MPAWFLVEAPGFLLRDQSIPTSIPPVWNPTVEHMLEDGLLMVGLFLIRPPHLVAMADASFQGHWRERVSLYRQITADKLADLRKALRDIEVPDSFDKLAVMVLQGASVTNQVQVLDQYPWGYELCLSSASKDSPKVMASKRARAGTANDAPS